MKEGRKEGRKEKGITIGLLVAFYCRRFRPPPREAREGGREEGRERDGAGRQSRHSAQSEPI